MSPRIARTVALETGIQNGPLAIAIIQLSFDKDKCLQSQMITPRSSTRRGSCSSPSSRARAQQGAATKRAILPGETQAMIVPDAAKSEGARSRRALPPRGHAGDALPPLSRSTPPRRADAGSRAPSASTASCRLRHAPAEQGRREGGGPRGSRTPGSTAAAQVARSSSGEGGLAPGALVTLAQNRASG